MTKVSVETIQKMLETPAGIIPVMKCYDGFSMSVQAGEYHYCSPRNSGPYTSVEVGFPSERVESLMEYAEQPDNPTGSVYAWVPIEVIVDIINEHGGIYGT